MQGVSVSCRLPVSSVGYFDAGSPLIPAYEHRFWLEPHAPDFLDALLDLIFQRDHIGGRGSAAIDDGERVLAGNADAAKRISPREAGVLDQPGGRDFVLGLERWIAWDFESFGFGALHKNFVLFLRKNRVLEK